MVSIYRLTHRGLVFCGWGERKDDDFFTEQGYVIIYPSLNPNDWR